MSRVLIVDDERKMRRMLQILLEQMNLDSVPAESAEEALGLFETEQFSLVLTDMKMPGMDGIELLSRLRAIDPDLPVIVLTAHGTVETAVTAMKLGAVDFVLKPFDLEAIEVVIRRALDLQRFRIENRYLRDKVETDPAFHGMIGDSAAMREVKQLIQQVAPARATVLISGETGSGKELVARAIHNASSRKTQLFVPINCAAIPADLLESELFGHTRGAFTGAQADRAGKFEVSDGGTLFLDEIGEMPPALQAKLLRVLEDGFIERLGSNKRIKVDVRIVCATNRDLPAMIREGRFREDLYYRLNVLQLKLAPLRERVDDIAPLAVHFLERFAHELGRTSLRFDDAALKLLEQYPWPGNVRELRNLVERAAVLSSGTVVEPTAFRDLAQATIVPPKTQDKESFLLAPAVEDVERRVILRALAASSDNKLEAAGLLGVSERTLWYKLKKYGL